MTHSAQNGHNTSHRFSALYVEEAAFSYAMTRTMIEKFSDCPVIPIHHYKDLFNRNRQDQGFQKSNPALVLAVKSDPILYPGPAICQSFGHTRFRLAHLMLNCPFDCSYCFLQGLYPSAFQVAYMNLEDYFEAMTVEAASGPYYLALSHDTDLLASHTTVPYLDVLIPWLRNQTQITAEVRTKTAVRDFFQRHEPASTLIFAFSLAPNRIISEFENKAPALEARIKTIQTAIERGFRVRLCFDPIIAGEQYQSEYESFFESLFRQIDPNRIVDVSYGFFRIPDTLFRRIAKKRLDTALYLESMPCEQKTRSYPLSVRQRLTQKHMAILTQFLPREKIFTV